MMLSLRRRYPRARQRLRGRKTGLPSLVDCGFYLLCTALATVAILRFFIYLVYDAPLDYARERWTTFQTGLPAYKTRIVSSTHQLLASICELILYYFRGIFDGGKAYYFQARRKLKKAFRSIISEEQDIFYDCNSEPANTPPSVNLLDEQRLANPVATTSSDSSPRLSDCAAAPAEAAPSPSCSSTAASTPSTCTVCAETPKTSGSLSAQSPVAKVTDSATIQDAPLPHHGASSCASLSRHSPKAPTSRYPVIVSSLAAVAASSTATVTRSTFTNPEPSATRYPAIVAPTESGTRAQTGTPTPVPSHQASGTPQDGTPSKTVFSASARKAAQPTSTVQSSASHNQHLVHVSERKKREKGEGADYLLAAFLYPESTQKQQAAFSAPAKPVTRADVDLAAICPTLLSADILTWVARGDPLFAAAQLQVPVVSASVPVPAARPNSASAVPAPALAEPEEHPSAVSEAPAEPSPAAVQHTSTPSDITIALPVNGAVDVNAPQSVAAADHILSGTRAPAAALSTATPTLDHSVQPSRTTSTGRRVHFNLDDTPRRASASLESAPYMCLDDGSVNSASHTDSMSMYTAHSIASSGTLQAKYGKWLRPHAAAFAVADTHNAQFMQDALPWHLRYTKS